MPFNKVRLKFGPLIRMHFINLPVFIEYLYPYFPPLLFLSFDISQQKIKYMFRIRSKEWRF